MAASELSFTDTNAGDDSAGRVFGLDGNLYLPVAGAIVGGIGLAAFLAFVAQMNPVASGLVGLLPIVGTSAWVGLLKHGKPAGYDRDWIDQKLGGGDFTPPERPPLARSHADAPDARFVRGMLLFGSPEIGGLVAKGFRLEPSDLRGASFTHLNGFQEKLKTLLALATPGRRLQFQWACDSDYRAELLSYAGFTDTVTNPAVASAREERFTRYWRRMTDRTLRREHLILFLSIEITAKTGLVGTRGSFEVHYDTLLAELAGQFGEFESTLKAIFGAEMPVRPLGDREHFDLYRRFLNPGFTTKADAPSDALFDPARTVQENGWHGEGVGQPDGGFVLDGRHHAILTLARWPQRTRPGMIVHLTGLPFLDYAITVNVTPITTRGEISKEERAAERLRGEYAGKPRPSLLVALRKKERKVEALSGGFVRPFHVTYVIRVWAPTKETLREKLAAVQAAIHAMDGAQYFESAIPTSAKKLFFATWPGWTHSSYRHRQLYAEDTFLADLLPFSATFTGSLEKAEALYDGSQGNLVGVATQVGGSPQHALLTGMTGAGKSAFIHDLLLQTAGHFAYTVIIEEGLSYKNFTSAMGEQPIVVHPDSPLTLNYLDTGRLPLTQLHLSTATALLARMVGIPDRAEDLAVRQAQLTQYLHQLYRDTWTDWSRRHPTKANDVRRFACGVARWRELMPASATPLEAFADLRDRRDAKDEQACELLASLTENDLTRFAQESATERLVAQTACAFFEPQDFPTHSALVELLAFARFPEHPKDEIDRLATLLRAWTAEGQYGKLFDGTTNVSLSRRVAHFELGLVPEQAVELKAAVGLLISGMTRQHIVSLPRALRKAMVYEEAVKLLAIPGGKQIMAESYAQLRKFNCWALSILQQQALLPDDGLRATVVGNSKQFFFMRQSDKSDLARLKSELGLPETAADAIQRYPLPEQLSGSEKHSSVCLFNPTAQPPSCGTLRHFAEVNHAS
ncbi:MAG: hypothetical protein JWM32_1269 [Verrucomicrobia bacterium]|nr:hypothetical protein [Verrucomicrobiota bacterium]